MRTRKIKRNLYLIIPLIIIILALFLIISGLQEEITGKVTEQPKEAKYEITKTDVFSDPNTINLREVSVKGVILGYNYNQVIEKLGIPDLQLTPEPEILNLEFGKSLNLEETGIIIQLRDNVVRRITLRKPFNEFLTGKTKITHTKDEIYTDIIGKPDEIFIIPETPVAVNPDHDPASSLSPPRAC